MTPIEEELERTGDAGEAFDVFARHAADLLAARRGWRRFAHPGRRSLKEHVAILAAWEGWLARQPESVLASAHAAQPRLWLELGLMWERMGDRDAAMACFRRQGALPSPAGARLEASVRLARLLVRSGALAEALRVAEDAERDPYRDFVMLGELGLQKAQALARLGAFDEARAEATRCLRRAWAVANPNLTVSGTLFLAGLHARRLRPDLALAVVAVSAYRSVKGPLFPDKARRLLRVMRKSGRARPTALVSPPGSEEIARIAVVRLDRLGDIVCCLPAFRLLRKRFPQAEITAWVGAGLEFVLEQSGHCDRVFGVDRSDRSGFRRSRAELLRRPHDLLIDLLDLERGWQLAFLEGCSARYRLGFDTPSRRWSCNLRVARPPERLHLSDQAVHLLSALGVASAPGTAIPHLALAPETASRAEAILSARDANGPLVALHPGSGYPFKYWPADKFAALADRLSEVHDARIQVLAGPGEEELAREIARRARAPVALPATPTLPDLASVLARCDLFVGLDTGPMHLAGALGTPVVVIWGAGDLRMFGPRWPNSQVVTHGAICAACPQEGHPVYCAMGYTRETAICLTPITVDEVFEAASGALQARRGSRGAAS